MKQCVFCPGRAYAAGLKTKTSSTFDIFSLTFSMLLSIIKKMDIIQGHMTASGSECTIGKNVFPNYN